MHPGDGFELGGTYKIKYIQKLYPDGQEFVTKIYKVREKNMNTGKLLVDGLEEENIGGSKYIRMDAILEANKINIGGRRRRLRKSRKMKRKTTRKSRRTSRK